MTRETFCGVSRGTLGELYQGPLWVSGRPEIAIVSLPVRKYSRCYFTADAGSEASYATDLTGRPKTIAAIARLLELSGRPAPRGRWELVSELPVGKGMASSTADIVAALRCLFDIVGVPCDLDVVTEILHGIERSDAVFRDDFVLYLSAQHRTVRAFEGSLGLHACYVVEAAAVDTDEVTDRLLAHYSRNASRYRRCLGALVDAFRRHDAAGVAESATLSAELSQDVLPKECFAEVLEHRGALGADGVFVAHTGSVVGYLLREKPGPALVDELSAFFRGLGRRCAFAQV